MISANPHTTQHCQHIHPARSSPLNSSYSELRSLTKWNKISNKMKWQGHINDEIIWCDVMWCDVQTFSVINNITILKHFCAVYRPGQSCTVLYCTEHYHLFFHRTSISPFSSHSCLALTLTFALPITITINRIDRSALRTPYTERIGCSILDPRFHVIDLRLSAVPSTHTTKSTIRTAQHSTSVDSSIELIPSPHLYYLRHIILFDLIKKIKLPSSGFIKLIWFFFSS